MIKLQLIRIFPLLQQMLKRTPTDFLMDHVTRRMLPHDLQERSDSSRKDKLHALDVECGPPDDKVRSLFCNSGVAFPPKKTSSCLIISGGRIQWHHLQGLFTFICWAECSLCHYLTSFSPSAEFLKEMRLNTWIWPIVTTSCCVCRSFDLRPFPLLSGSTTQR